MRVRDDERSTFGKWNMLLIRPVHRRLRSELGFLRRRLTNPPLPQQRGGPLLVRIGYEAIDSPEFVNVDAHPYLHAHNVRNDITDLSMFANASVDLARYAAGICTVGQHATFFRRRAFERAGGFNPANRISWDGELLVDMALAGARFASVSNVLDFFRIYAESITGSNKHLVRARKEHERGAAKIRLRGVPLYSPLKQILQRALYKANLARHVGYLRAR